MFGTEKDPNLDCSPQNDTQHADISDCDASCDASGLCLQSSNNGTVVRSTCSRSPSYLTGKSRPGPLQEQPGPRRAQHTTKTLNPREPRRLTKDPLSCSPG